MSFDHAKKTLLTLRKSRTRITEEQMHHATDSPLVTRCLNAACAETAAMNAAADPLATENCENVDGA